jgi:hypothetical protein
MGMYKKRCRMGPCNPQALAPNPLNFKFTRVMQVGGHTVAEIRYPDCKNYEGLKVLLFKETDAAQLMKREHIDPHFGHTLNAPFARFTPAAGGWDAAVRLARIL